MNWSGKKEEWNNAKSQEGTPLQKGWQFELRFKEHVCKAQATPTACEATEMAVSRRLKECAPNEFGERLGKLLLSSSTGLLLDDP